MLGYTINDVVSYTYLPTYLHIGSIVYSRCFSHKYGYYKNVCLDAIRREYTRLRLFITIKLTIELFVNVPSTKKVER